MSKFAELFDGVTLNGKDGPVDPKTLDGLDAVGLYFSAHWCPPCRAFTPEFAEKYMMLQSAGKKFEVIFVSADKTEDEYNEYWGSMPWQALPFDAKAVEKKLSKQFGIQGIPSLVILNGDAEIITKDGVQAISSATYAEKFPWVPPTLHELLGTTFKKGEADVSWDDEVKGKTIGLYFSASWCGPCRGFTPILTDVYNKLTGEGKDFQVIFCSSDRDEGSFKEYYGKMPWLALPFEKREEKELLSSRFGVRGIPTLVILDADTGDVINAGGTSAIRGDTTGSDFPWWPKSINDLSVTADGINGWPAILLLGENADDLDVLAQVEALRPIADAVYKTAREAKAEPEMRFFFATTSGGAVPQIRGLTKTAPSSTVTMILLDIDDNGGYYVSEDTKHTTESIQAFIDGYKAKTLTRQQMS